MPDHLTFSDLGIAVYEIKIFSNVYLRTAASFQSTYIGSISSAQQDILPTSAEVIPFICFVFLSLILLPIVSGMKFD